jgi:23S rRNA (uracil1939-C5)-methyltransferase
VAETTITLTIEKLAGLGDGTGTYEGRKIFVPCTLAGDVVRVRPVRETADATHAVLEEILTPSPQRIAPVCVHFGACGGCTLQHLSKTVYQDFKQGMALAAVRKAGYDAGCVAPLIILPAASRRRAELKVEDGKLGFYEAGSHTLVDIRECHILEPQLFTLLLRLKPWLLSLGGLKTLQINGVDGGYDLLLEGGSSAKWQPKPDPSLRRISARHNDQVTTLYENGPVTVSLGDISVNVPPGAFLQASREAQDLMIGLVTKAMKGARNVLDLFAGIGTYSFALAKHAQVTAIEGDNAMVEAIQEASNRHSLNKKLTAQRRDLFHRPLNLKDLAAYDGVVLNPPRTGAKAQCEVLAAIKIPRLVMVSCNPATFARDAKLLREGGYQLAHVTPIDQFVYSSHLELVAEFLHIVT